MQISQDAAARRLGDQSNVLAAQSSAEQQAAIESANTRNMNREQLRLASDESMKNRNLDSVKLQEGSRQFEKQFSLDEKISNQNMKIAIETMKQNGQGMMQQFINQLFGTGLSWDSLSGKSSKSAAAPTTAPTTAPKTANAPLQLTNMRAL